MYTLFRKVWIVLRHPTMPRKVRFFVSNLNQAVPGEKFPVRFA
jgi:hypothetical protein